MENCSKYQLGKEAEENACQYLCERGLKLITRNYRAPFGEIDLIMQDERVLVFVEVRQRLSSNYGNAIESIGYKKQQRLIRTSRHYLQKTRLFNKVTSRFDIIAIHPIKTKLQLEWIKNVIFDE